jgi:anthranilate phosphoribosyltransferase
MHVAIDAAFPAAAETMRSIIQRIATGPEYSKDISRQEARQGMLHILENQVHPVQAAIFLIALRMKRETDDENTGILDALREVTHTVTAAVDEVVDIAEPYDGYTRTMPPSPFLPALLAACGVPTILHGVDAMGPKFGLTPHAVLRMAGLRVDLSPAEAAARLHKPEIGWAYIDQAAFCPKLYALRDLRTLIVKRPALSTIETVLGPIRGRQRTHLVTGYVHKPYPRIYALLARQAGFTSGLIMHGTEGGVVPSLRQAGTCFVYHDAGEEQAIDIQPSDVGIVQAVRAVPFPTTAHNPGQGEEHPPASPLTVMAQATVAAGLAAIGGQSGPFRDALLYGAALVLWHLQRYDSLRAAAAAVRRAIDTGQALAHFQAAA